MPHFHDDPICLTCGQIINRTQKRGEANGAYYHMETCKPLIPTNRPVYEENLYAETSFPVSAVPTSSGEVAYEAGASRAAAPRAHAARTLPLYAQPARRNPSNQTGIHETSMANPGYAEPPAGSGYAELPAGSGYAELPVSGYDELPGFVTGSLHGESEIDSPPYPPRVVYETLESPVRVANADSLYPQLTGRNPSNQTGIHEASIANPGYGWLPGLPGSLHGESETDIPREVVYETGEPHFPVARNIPNVDERSAKRCYDPRGWSTGRKIAALLSIVAVAGIAGGAGAATAAGGGSSSPSESGNATFPTDSTFGSTTLPFAPSSSSSSSFSSSPSFSTSSTLPFSSSTFTSSTTPSTSIGTTVSTTVSTSFTHAASSSTSSSSSSTTTTQASTSTSTKARNTIGNGPNRREALPTQAAKDAYQVAERNLAAALTQAFETLRQAATGNSGLNEPLIAQLSSNIATTLARHTLSGKRFNLEYVIKMMVNRIFDSQPKILYSANAYTLPNGFLKNALLAQGGGAISLRNAVRFAITDALQA